jgi:hypothetical protein
VIEANPLLAANDECVRGAAANLRERLVADLDDVLPPGGGESILAELGWG